ncbi:MAG: phenol degradation protein meta, partial [Rhodoblastus sp.]
MKRVFAHAFALASPLFAATAAFADEGGVSFWLPGTYGSLAAVPGTPGLNFTTFNYNDFASVDKNAYVVRMGAIQAGLASRTNE